MSYDLCLFDLDGTLTDPKPGITRSFQYALAAFGIHEELNDLTRFIGPPLRESFREYYGFSEAQTEAAVLKYREYFSVTGLFENNIYPHIPDLLERLKDKGKTLAVVTSKVTLYADQILVHFRLADYFVAVFGDEMDGSRTKNGKGPLVRSAIQALDPQRKMSPVMIGDRLHDILGAKDAEIDSIGITWGYGSRGELEAAGATWITDGADDLCRLLIKGINH